MKTRENKANSSAITDAEMVLLQALWDDGPGTVRDCAGRVEGREWAYTTVQTLLSRMEAKGLVTCDRTGQAHVFTAAVSRNGLLKGRLRELADQLCGGMSSPMVLALMDDTQLTPDEIAALREQLNRLEADGGTDRMDPKGATEVQAQ